MKGLARYYAAITGAMFLFGMSFVWTEGLLSQQHFPPQTLILLRLLIGGALMSLFLVLTKNFQRPAKKDLKWFLLLALFEPFIYFLGETNGLRLTQSPSLGAVILSTSPLFCMIACFLVFRERPGVFNLTGMLFTLPGVVLVMFTSNFHLHVPLQGVCLLFTAAISTAGYAVIIRKLEHYSAITIVAFQNLAGACYFLPLVAAFEPRALAAISWTADVWYPLVMLSLFVSAAAFVLYVSAVKKLGITQSSLFTALIPAVTTVAAFLMGRETMTWQQALGVGVVIFGLILSQYKGKGGKRPNQGLASLPEG
jgi:drug/metabolite transporter (DMT)-like permease